MQPGFTNSITNFLEPIVGSARSGGQQPSSRPITIDAAARDESSTTPTVLRAGLVMMQIAANGKCVPYGQTGYEGKLVGILEHGMKMWDGTAFRTVSSSVLATGRLKSERVPNLDLQSAHILASQGIEWDLAHYNCIPGEIREDRSISGNVDISDSLLDTNVRFSSTHTGGDIEIELPDPTPGYEIELYQGDEGTITARASSGGSMPSGASALGTSISTSSRNQVIRIVGKRLPSGIVYISMSSSTNYLPGEAAARSAISYPNARILQAAGSTYRSGRAWIDYANTTGSIRTIQPGRCALFDGTNDTISFAAGTGTTSAFTIAFWTKVVSYSSFGMWIGGNGTLDFRMNTTTGIPEFSGTNGVTSTILADTAIPLGEWHHVAMTFNAGTVNIYVDAVLWKSGTTAFSTLTWPTTWHIGSRAGSSFWLNAYMFDLRILNRAITQSELETLGNPSLAISTNLTGTVGHYQLDGPTGVPVYDASVTSNDGTLAGTQPSFFYTGSDVPYSFQNTLGYTGANRIPPQRPGMTLDATGAALGYTGEVPKDPLFKQSHACLYNGTTDYTGFSIHPLTSAADFTICFWASIADYTAEGMFIAAVNGGYVEVRQTSLDGHIRTVSGATSTWDVTSSQATALNTPVHVTITKSGTSIKIYQNAVETGSGTASSASAPLYDSMQLGARQTNLFPISGSMWDVRFYTRVLTTTEIGHVYADDLSDPVDCAAWYPCSDKGTTVHNVIANFGHGTRANSQTARTLQDKFHYNLRYGFRIVSGTSWIPALSSGASAANGAALTNPAVAGYNFAETAIDFQGGVSDATWLYGRSVESAWVGAARTAPKYKLVNSSVFETNFYVFGNQKRLGNVTFVGDSITVGLNGTNIDAASYVSRARMLIQRSYGNGGEGFMSPLYGGEQTIPTLKPTKWVTTGTWITQYAATYEGAGALASRTYSTSGATASMVIAGSRVGIVGPVNNATAGTMAVAIDGVSAGTINQFGTGVTSAMTYGDVTWFTLPDTNTHTVTVSRSGSSGTIFLEGLIVDRASGGMRIDRHGKGWMRASFLGVVNDSNPTAEYFHALSAIHRIGDSDIYVVALGINDYINQVSTSTFESTLTTVVQRLKAHGTVFLLACPQPDSDVGTDYSLYVDKIVAVGAAESCTVINIFSDWGGIFVSARMQDLNHPNDIGHNLIGDAVFTALQSTINTLPGS